MQGVPYEDDESNDSDDYERNRVRHHQLEKMSEADRRQLLAEWKQTMCTSLTCSGRLMPSWLPGTGVCSRCCLITECLHPAALGAHALWHHTVHSAQRDLLRRLRSDKPQWTQPLDDRWQLKRNMHASFWIH
ncbi:MAG: hypothetical protein ACLVJ6_00820 [Merdibacter sp.]